MGLRLTIANGVAYGQDSFLLRQVFSGAFGSPTGICDEVRQ